MAKTTDKTMNATLPRGGELSSGRVLPPDVRVLDVHRLADVMTQAAVMGAHEYRRGIDFQSDTMTRAQVLQRIRHYSYFESDLLRWERTKLLRGYKRGSSKTSRIIYSRAELERLLTALRLEAATIGFDELRVRFGFKKAMMMAGRAAMHTTEMPPQEGLER